MNTPGNTVSDLAARVGGSIVGDGDTQVYRVASLAAAGEGEIAYVEDEKLFDAAAKSEASCLIVPAGANINAACRIEVKNPKLVFALISEVLHPPKKRAPEIHPSSVIAENARIGPDVFIGG